MCKLINIKVHPTYMTHRQNKVIVNYYNISYFHNSNDNTLKLIFFAIILKKRIILKKKRNTKSTHDDLSILVIEFSFPCVQYVFYHGATRVYAEYRDSAFTLETFWCKAWCDGPVRQMSAELAFLYRCNEHV